jgi:hypothetical protein
VRPFILAAIAVLCLSGCGSLPGDLKKAIPNGKWETVTATINGKFSSTQIEANGVVKVGDVLTAKELHVRHSNAWVPLIEYKATGFTPAESQPASVTPTPTKP